MHNAQFKSQMLMTKIGCQAAVRCRFIPISYAQWFNSAHNKTKAFYYMSRESFECYYRWCEYVSGCPSQIKIE